MSARNPAAATESVVLADGEVDDGDGYEWCWIACPHDPPCADAPRSSDPRDE